MRLDSENRGEKWKIRPDGEEKVTGKLRYLTDLTLPEVLYGKVLRSGIPHAQILSIDISKAIVYEGVKAVLTHSDIPGINGFGIAQPDQPVFCDKHVRYEGDAIACVAAVTEEIATEALKLIRVEYEELPVLSSPEAALVPTAPKLHENGNILHETKYFRGDIDAAFQICSIIVEETYITPRQMHTYLETEGGLFVPSDGGNIEIYAPTQHGYKDRMQLARILAIPEEKIRVISSPIGGSFGGKDELNVQPYGALLALHTGMPVKMHFSRWESVKAGLKRHPMKIKMKTGTDSQGKIIAHQVKILSDTGAYSTLGAPVLNFATEHCIGPYQIPNVKVDGKAVYTNNGVSGEFRGFGGNQVIFALEGQIDRLAAKVELDPWEFRSINLRKKDDLGPLGQRIVPTTGASDVWGKIQESDLWKKRFEKPNVKKPWARRGVGAAMAMHGSGLGYGLPDHGGGTIRLNKEGKIEVAFGHEEMGQGLLSTIEILLIDHFQCSKDDISIIIGDTDRVPVSGSSTASRTTNMVWQALNHLKPPFCKALFEAASNLTGIEMKKLRTGPGGIWIDVADQSKCVITYQELAKINHYECSREFHFPTTPDPIVGAHYLYTCTAVVCEVEVNLLTGMVDVFKIDHVVAAGPVVNPMGYLGQIEGGGIMALGFTLHEDAVMDVAQYVTKNLDTYLIPTIFDVPVSQSVEAIEKLLPDDQYGPRGVGEVGTVALAPAIVAAINQATGKWLTKLPVKPESLLEPIFSKKSAEARQFPS
ncbi:xanthine dehydrogenase subunit D [Anaerobacillus alkalidiazotrophicus]|uniref:Xanthine dehydrogenase subunit D n=1 Tax=Anaerobacillus alkalidiazotrophicus TaxID=472963 RepID=A0A1S2M883_9BACI|nr:xanthine dehydrogenase subunit D [Anaerobacillus alkalidiazotrophicus]OIJ20796.1 xanthine dehydrogenase subunit D [Anaerobacillus alkalidiazotrophicus]